MDEHGRPPALCSTVRARKRLMGRELEEMPYGTVQQNTERCSTVPSILADVLVVIGRMSFQRTAGVIAPLHERFGVGGCINKWLCYHEIIEDQNKSAPLAERRTARNGCATDELRQRWIHGIWHGGYHLTGVSEYLDFRWRSAILPADKTYLQPQKQVPETGSSGRLSWMHWDLRLRDH